jgi:hypothetical protein
MPSKTIFKSKTAVVNFIIAVAGVVSFFDPSAAEFVKSHAVLELTAIGFVNMALRLITHGRITLFGSE